MKILVLTFDGIGALECNESNSLITQRHAFVIVGYIVLVDISEIGQK